MSSWVANQRQAAFFLWRRYLAMGLHFRPASGFDYGLYSGATNATQAAFARRPKAEVLKFIQLNNRLGEINQDEFLFANARYEHLSIDKLLSKDSFWIHEKWKESYGDSAKFRATVKNLGKEFFATLNQATPLDQVVLKILDAHDQKWIELVAWILQNHIQDFAKIKAQVSDNILYKMQFDRIVKVQKLYSYLCII